MFDLGASTKLTHDASQLTPISRCRGSNRITMGNGKTIPSAIRGVVAYFLLLPISFISLILFIHLNFPIDNNCLISFDAHGYVIKDLKTNNPHFSGTNSNGLYLIRPTRKSPSSSNHTAYSVVQDISSSWDICLPLRYLIFAL